MIRIAALALSWALYDGPASAQSIAVGKQQYMERCAGCHGEDGTGGHGPAIVNLSRPRATSRETVRYVILNGIPGGGMPSFRIAEEEANAIAVYVSTLRTPAPASGAISGDAAAGERFFAQKGNCLSCHMVHGRGGVLGPDLSNVGRERTQAQLQQALVDPGGGRGGRGGTRLSRAVTVRLRGGRTLRGIAKNESAFDLQLLGTDGELHLLLKEQVAEITPEKSLMPKVEASQQSIGDLVAYLSSLKLDPDTQARLAEGEMGPGVRFADVAVGQ